jgi:hypothetical protein
MDQGRYCALIVAFFLTGGMTLQAAGLPSSEQIMKLAIHRAALNPSHS